MTANDNYASSQAGQERKNVELDEAKRWEIVSAASAKIMEQNRQAYANLAKR